MNKEERSHALRVACGGDIAPKVIARKILDSPDDYSPLEHWLAVNYEGAMLMLDMDKLMTRIEDGIVEYKKRKNR